jgi:hypothetical protein
MGYLFYELWLIFVYFDYALKSLSHCFLMLIKFFVCASYTHEWIELIIENPRVGSSILPPATTNYPL